MCRVVSCFEIHFSAICWHFAFCNETLATHWYFAFSLRHNHIFKHTKILPHTQRQCWIKLVSWWSFVTATMLSWCARARNQTNFKADGNWNTYSNVQVGMTKAPPINWKTSTAPKMLISVESNTESIEFSVTVRIRRSAVNNG